MRTPPSTHKAFTWQMALNAALPSVGRFIQRMRGFLFLECRNNNKLLKMEKKKKKLKALKLKPLDDFEANGDVKTRSKVL
jgi:hypothetical protein